VAIFNNNLTEEEKMNLKKHVFPAVILCLLSTAAFAIEPIPEESGFSGFLSLGLGGNRVKSNMISGNRLTDIGDDTISSITGSPGSESEALPAINFELKYTFAETRTQLFAGNALEDVLRYDLIMQLGVRQDLQNLGIVAGSFVFNGIPTEVWEDPYLTNQSRDETDRTSNGFRLTWDKILSSNFQVQCTARNIEIDDERSGYSLGFLTPDQRRLLRREGDLFQTEVLYRFNLSDSHTLIPAFVFTKEDLDGDAMSNDTFDFQLTYHYSKDRLNIIANGLLGRSDYDKKNPIYNKTQEDDRYGAAVTAFYGLPDYKPFGCNKFSIWGNVAYYTADADIDFYETEVFGASAGVMIRY